MGVVDRPNLEPMVGDPDDHRPESRWALLTDEQVDGVAAVVEDVAVGDRIPLHTHPVDEVIFFRNGAATVTLGEDRASASSGAVVFVPAGTPHRTENVGDEPVSLFAVFPSTLVGIRYLERNPAPGTESDAPQAPMTIDLRSGDVVADGHDG